MSAAEAFDGAGAASAAGSVNVHATAIVLGTRGLIFLGAPGAGKSDGALRCLAGARRRGIFAALVGDDQVFVRLAGGRLVASAPPATRGLIELRGTGIAPVPVLDRAVLHLAVLAGAPAGAGRLPQQAETVPVGPGVLPAVRLRPDAQDPFCVLAAARPGLGLLA